MKRSVKILVISVLLLPTMSASSTAVPECVDPNSVNPNSDPNWYDRTSNCPLLDSGSWGVSDSYDGGYLSTTVNLDWRNPTPETRYGNDIIIGNQDLYLQLEATVYDCNNGNAENFRQVYPWSYGWGGGGFDASGTYSKDISTTINDGDGVSAISLNIAVDSGNPGPDGSRTTPTYHLNNDLTGAGQFSCSNPNSAPSASLTVNDTSIMQGETVEYTYSGSDSDGSVQSMQIDFGDGQTSPSYSSDGTVEHTYSSDGSYTAELTVTDDNGASTTDTANTVSVSPGCDYFLYRPNSKTRTLGEDVYFQVWHNNVADCPSPTDVKFEVCGTNLTSSGGYLEEQSRPSSAFFGGQYPRSFNVTFNTQNDVTCGSPNNPVKFWDGSGNIIGDDNEELQLSREPTKGTPIHENGKYKPQAEIIVGTEMEKQSFMDPANGNFANRSSTKFYICRGGYRGQDISSSKLVKVQDGRDPASATWNYYRCAMNGTWMEASCEPGQELVQDPSAQDSYICQTVAPQTITATYFNIQDIPHSGKTNGYIAGFKIPELDISIYEDVMGFKPQKVDAECWMGDDNQRPTDSSNSVVFTSTYDGSGDLWALAEIPPRSGVNKNTYSCVWGIKNVGSTADTNVYESTNNIPLKAKDGGRNPIQYNIIESRRTSADIDTGTPRGIWSKYEAPADGGYDQRTYIQGTNHLMLNGEYSYCSGNSFLDASPVIDKGSLLQNILCSGSGGYSGYPDTFNSP